MERGSHLFSSCQVKTRSKFQCNPAFDILNLMSIKVFTSPKNFKKEQTCVSGFRKVLLVLDFESSRLSDLEHKTR